MLIINVTGNSISVISCYFVLHINHSFEIDEHCSSVKSSYLKHRQCMQDVTLFFSYFMPSPLARTLRFRVLHLTYRQLSSYYYVHKLDAQRINIKWWAWLYKPGRRRRRYSTSGSEHRRQLSQPAVSRYLRYPSERTFSDNCLGTQHPALSPSGRHNLAADIAHRHRHSTRNDTSFVVAVFLELLEPI